MYMHVYFYKHKYTMCVYSIHMCFYTRTDTHTDTLINALTRIGLNLICYCVLSKYLLHAWVGHI